MSRHQQGRKVRDREEARRLLARLEKSGMSLSDFCLRHQINVHSLSGHRQYLESQEKPPLRAIDFVEVKVAPPEPVAAASYRVELPNGVALTVTDHFTPTRLQHLIEVLRAC
jgi:hypothetical protein